MNRDMFTKHVVVADHDPADVLGASGMLGSTADDGVLAEFVMTAGFHACFHHGSRGHNAVIAEFDVGLHAGKGPNAHADTQSGLGTDVGQRMNAHGVFHAERGRHYRGRVSDHRCTQRFIGFCG